MGRDGIDGVRVVSNTVGALVLALLAGGCGRSGGQAPGRGSGGLFRGGINYEAGEYPMSTVAGDLTGDGKADLVVASRSGAQLLVNRGDGTFALPVLVGPGANGSIDIEVAGVAVSDLNGDGHLDLLVEGGEGEVAIFLNEGHGAFHPGVAYDDDPDRVVMGGLAVGDLNGDAKPDVAHASLNTLEVLLNQGTGVLGASARYRTNTTGGPATLVDVTGDGRLDVVVPTDLNLSIHANAGDGSFLAPVDHPVSEAMTLWVGSGDLDGDGKAELVVTTERLSSNVTVFNGRNDGTTLGARTDLTVAGRATLGTIADVNGDGPLDLVILNETLKTVAVFLNGGRGDFGPPVEYVVGGNPSSIVASDLDGDDRPDFAVPQRTNVTVLLNEGRGTFPSPTRLDVGKVPARFVVGDLDGDGLADVIASFGDYMDNDPIGGHIDVRLGLPNFSFAPPIRRALEAEADANAMLLGDLDGDGRDDLVVTANGLTVLLNRGGGAFAEPLSYQWDSAHAFTPMAIADIDSDGRADVLGSGGFDVRVALNTGGGVLAIPIVTNITPLVFALRTGDLNADGAVDLVLGTREGAAVMLNNGHGSFEQPVTYRSTMALTDANVFALATADLDGDGRVDVLVINRGTPTAAVLKNMGNGVLAPPVEFDAGREEFGAAVGDLDRDGRLDFVTLTTAGGVRAFINDGQGSFSRSPEFALGTANTVWALFDVDATGSLDVVGFESPVGEVRMLLNSTGK